MTCLVYLSLLGTSFLLFTLVYHIIPHIHCCFFQFAQLRLAFLWPFFSFQQLSYYKNFIDDKFKCNKYTFVRARNYFMFLVGMFKHTLRTEHFSVIFTVKLDLFTFMNITSDHRRILSTTSWWRGLMHWKGCKYGIVGWQVIHRHLMLWLVEGAFDHLVLADLFETLETEGVATR